MNNKSAAAIAIASLFYISAASAASAPAPAAATPAPAQAQTSAPAATPAGSTKTTAKPDAAKAEAAKAEAAKAEAAKAEAAKAEAAKAEAETKDRTERAKLAAEIAAENKQGQAASPAKVSASDEPDAENLSGPKSKACSAALETLSKTSYAIDKGENERCNKIKEFNLQNECLSKMASKGSAAMRSAQRQADEACEVKR